MQKERLFELAVQLTAAQISAGQYQSLMNFETIVGDYVAQAYEQLCRVWAEAPDPSEVPHSGK